MVDLDIDRPCYLSHKDWFQLAGKIYPPGLYLHGISNNSGNSMDFDEYISAPLTVEAITSNPDGSDFGRILRFCDSNGKWHDWSMPMRLLKGSGEDLLAELLDQGLVFDTKKRALLIRYIMQCKTTKRIQAASSIGWHGKTFVLPHKVIGDGEIVFQAETVGDHNFKTDGTLSAWNDSIGKYCVGNTPLIVSVATAITGPLIKILNRQQGGGIHWTGDSSIGKTTIVEVAASCWGSPDFTRSWSATANGLEGIIAMLNDTCIILDEIDEALPNEVMRINYMLGNGQGKQRAGRTGNARRIKRWRTMALSTGERTLSSIMNDAQKIPNSGQLIRLLNVSAEYEHGVFSNLHGFDSGRSFSDHLKSARLKNYGTLGPAFIECLIRDERDIAAYFQDILDVISVDATNKLEERAASTLALIATAGELAIEYGLLPWVPTTVLYACRAVYKQWKIDTIGGLTEDERILENIRTFIDKQGETRLSLLDSTLIDNHLRERAGWYKDTGGVRTYMLFGFTLVEAAKKFEKARIVKALIKANWICDHSKNRNTKKTRVPGGTKELYYIQIPCDTDEADT